MKRRAGSCLAVVLLLSLGAACSNRDKGGGAVATVARQSALTNSFGGCSKQRVDTAVGFLHSCALLADGTVECWGSNQFGALGFGPASATPFPNPVPVPNLSDVQAITAGDYHTCALLRSGAVRCWGSNGDGELGNGATNNSPTPVNVLNLGGVTAISAGFNYSCAVVTNGAVRCWGANDRGQLGTGNINPSPVPVPVIGLSNAVQISTGSDHTCALLSDGTARCWGDDTYGELGTGAALGLTSVPVVVAGLSGLVDISAGGGHTCAVSGGTVRCWGRNGSGELGDGTTTDSLVPLTVPGLSNAVRLAQSPSAPDTCALLSDGTARCWGDNQYGALGNGTFGNQSSTPGPVSNLASVTGMSISTHTCAVLSDGRLECWGYGFDGELGNGTTNAISTAPVLVPGGGFSPGGQICRATAGPCDAAEVCDGVSNNCPVDVLAPAGAVCRNTVAACETAAKCDGASISCPPNPVGPCPECSSTALTISAGETHTCGLLPGGKVECWGGNSSGQLGNGTTQNASTPVVVPGLEGVLSVTSGGWATCAVMPDATVKCWGNNQYGQLGNGTMTTLPNPTPVTVNGLTNVTALAGGYGHFCALHPNGTVDCWGYDLLGALGNGTALACPPCGTSSPVPVIGLTNVTSISAAPSGYYTCARISDGTVSCWGDNQYGQIGFSGSNRSFVPRTIPGVAGALAVSAGSNHACALLADHSLTCWGLGGSGERGDGTTVTSPTPTPVVGIDNAVVVSAGTNVTCALLSGGMVDCWGWNAFGLLGGASTQANQLTPALVPSLNGVTAISTGVSHICVLLGGSGMKCWSENDVGQLGNNTTVSSGVPVPVVCPQNTGGSDAGTPPDAGDGGTRFPPGHTCASGPECASDICVDGVCCKTACGGGAGDCQACSTNFGGSLNGTCTPLVITPVCRGIAGQCDVAERCNSTSLDCPPDVFQTGTTCRSSRGPCDAEETCTGNSADCPADQAAAQGVLCHEAANICETSTVCPGNSFVCPAPSKVPGCISSVEGTLSWNGVTVSGGAASSLHLVGYGSFSGFTWSAGVDGSGHYGSGDVSPDPYTVIVNGNTCGNREGSDSLTSAQVNVPAGLTTTLDFDLTASAGLVSGTITQSGSPVQGSFMINDGDCGELATDVNGHFAALFPPGDYTATPFFPGVATDSIPFTVLTGQITNINLGTSAAPAGPGDTCPNGDECGTDLFCVDGVCCTTTCGGGANDCQACSVAKGGTTDGTCTPLTTTPVCRTKKGTCDVEERCALDSLDCPGDKLADTSTQCYTRDKLCDSTETVGYCAGDGTCSTPPKWPANSCAAIDTGSPVPLLGGQGSNGGITVTPNGTIPAGGQISVTPMNSSCAVPPDFEVIAVPPPSPPSQFWNIDVSWSQKIPMQVCIGFDANLATMGINPCNLQILHGDETCSPSGWTNINQGGKTAVCLPNNDPINPKSFLCTTAGSLGTVACTRPNTVCGMTDTFSPFALVAPAATATPTITVPGNMTVEATGPTGAKVAFTVTASDPQDGTLTPTCSAASGSTFPIGTTDVSCSATDLDGFVATGSFKVTVRDTQGPPIKPPSTIVAYASSTSGACVTYAKLTATDAVDGTRNVTCTPASGSTFPLGKTTVTCTAADKKGNTTSASFIVWVQVQAPTDGSFFLPPIRSNGGSIFKIGRPVPVRFKLIGESAGITNLVAKLTVTKVSSAVQGTTVDTSDETVDDTDFVFKYRSGPKQYAYRWKTSNQTQGTYGLTADLGDLVVHQINVSLKTVP